MKTTITDGGRACRRGWALYAAITQRDLTEWMRHHRTMRCCL
jgi:hypothetical protein